MPYDPNDEDTKAALAEAVAKAVEKLEAKNRELIAEKRRQGEGKIDAAELERVEAERDALATKLATVEKEFKTLSKTAETATKALEAEQKHTQKLLISEGLAKALAEAGVTDPKLQRAAAALLRAENSIEVVVEGEARTAKVGDKALAEFVKGWAQGDDGKTFVAAPANSGGGATGGTGGGAVNPWAPDSRNMTEQGRMYKENPTQAKAMAAQHGVTLE